MQFGTEFGTLVGALFMTLFMTLSGAWISCLLQPSVSTRAFLAPQLPAR